MKVLVQKTRGWDGEGTGKKEYFLVYSVLFAVVAFCVFSWFFLTGRTLIYSGDGWHQHYKALVYYGRYLRSIIRGGLSGHQLVIPAWDFSIGEGSDILGTLNYYVIGDPFAFFSVFVPTRFMHIFYEAMVLLRMYLSGIAFSCLCFHTGTKSRYAVMAGTMAYVFCFWSMFTATRHPYFLNPMLYFPLLILGLEKILKKERPYLFIVAVFLSAVSNFYFFYMLVLATVLYAGARIISIYRKDIRAAFEMIFRMGICSVLGVLLAAVIILPTCYVFLNDTRMSAETAVHLFYPISYYAGLPSLFVTVGNPQWSCMGFAVPVLIAVFLLFCRRKKYGLLKTLFLICIVIFMLPYLGHVLNGFSYATNRWCWAFALLCAYILTVMWPLLMELNKKEGIILSVCTIVCFAYCLIEGNLPCFLLDKVHIGNVSTAAVLAFIFLFLVFPVKHGKGTLNKKRKQQLGLLLVIISVLSNSYWEFAPGGVYYSQEGVKAARISENLMSNEAAAVKKTAGKDGSSGFYRYSGTKLTRNANMMSGQSSTQYYWTLSNPYMIEFKKNLELAESHAHRYEGYSERAELLSLASVRYYAVPAGDNPSVPYGFSYADTFDGKYAVYRNDYELPLGYTYDTYLLEDRWNKFSAVEKQEALLQSLVLENGSSSFKEGTLVFKSKEVPYTISCKGDVTLQDHKFVVDSKKASVKLRFDGLTGSETYFSIDGLSFQDSPAKNKLLSSSSKSVQLKMKSSLGVTKRLGYSTEEYVRYNNRHEFAVNFGYSEDAVTSITIKFSKAGVYSFDTIKVTCQPMDSYGEWIAARKKDTLEHMEIAPNMVTGMVSTDKPKFLCLAIPYSKGWRAHVDGKETELLRANVQYMAVALEPGNHDIRLTYATPLLKEGGYVSIAAFLAFAAMVIIRERKLKAAGVCSHKKNAEYTHKGKGRG